MTLSTKIFLSLGLGVFTGLFFGEGVAFLQVPADIFVLLLQMTVLPYVTLSLIVGFGSLSYADAKLLAVRGTAVLLVLWGMALAVLALMPLAFPDWESASFFSASMIEERGEVDYLEIFIPSNPFYSMSRNLVPAVVVFSICLGVALIGVNNKQHLLSSFSVLKAALTRVTDFMVSLMPIGIFAIAASAAGTMHIEEFERLQVYLILYIAVSLLFTFWILPGLVAALTPIKYREILGLSKDAMVTAFMTATLLVVLPLLVENSKALLQRHKLETERSAGVLDAAIPASFNFPQTGKVLAMSFVLFAAWFTDTPISLAEYPVLMFSGLASFFGSLTVAVPFLLDLMKIPADMFQLFVISGVLNSRFGTLLAAMHTLVLGLLVTAAVTGGLKFQPMRLLQYAGITAVLTAGTIGGANVLFSYGLSNEYSKDQVIAGMHLLSEPVEAIVHKTPPPPPPPEAPGTSQRASIRERGYVRVGYLPDNLPFSFFNAAGDLVGFDVEMAHKLATEIGVTLEFVPVQRDKMAMQLDSNYCDIIMSGIVVTTRRATAMHFSRPYLNETLAFIVRDHRRHDFDNAEARKLLESPKIGDFVHTPDYVEIVRKYLPQAEFVPIDSVDAFFGPENASIDAILGTAERGAAMSLLHPDYAVALPQPDLVRVPLAYPLSYRNLASADFLDTWIRLKKQDGTIDALYRYWILGENAVPKKPRWSIIRNVLHWVD